VGGESTVNEAEAGLASNEVADLEVQMCDPTCGGPGCPSTCDAILEKHLLQWVAKLRDEAASNTVEASSFPWVALPGDPRFN